MLQLTHIREKTEEVIARLAIRNFDAKPLINQVLSLDNDRRKTQNELDALLNEANIIAKQVGDLFKQGKKEDAEVLKNKSAIIKESSTKLAEQLKSIEEEQQQALVQLPNTPHLNVPKGKTPEENENIHQEGELPKLAANAKPHWELTSQYDLIDFELGVKLTGAGFPVYKKQGARLQRALINFFLDKAIAAGYTEIQPPILVNEASAYATGQLPDKEGQMYLATVDNLYLIPTAEVPITNMYRDVILKKEQLPIKNCGYTPCFRREAGSYGKDVRGLNRLHQFDKIEIVQVVHPDKSYEAIEEMRDHVASVLRELELPFRILKLCGGDMSFASALTYDFETYSGAQQKWLEVSSVSNFETFQSNRLKLRFKEDGGKPQLLHTLNGSALALPRIVASLLENNQTSEGIKIPKSLIPYTGFSIIN
ncbi:MAG: serine--tRNA ligase [Bacteroidia bacterium]